jgi:hypothetical protein
MHIVNNALEWDIKAVSRKAIDVIDGKRDSIEVVSGHHGEFLGVLCGAWGSFLKRRNVRWANHCEKLIHQELDREARLFRQLRNTTSSVDSDCNLLKLTAILTHNVGDVDQGYSYWGDAVAENLNKHQLFSRLAHQRGDRFGGEFMRAKALYAELLSPEGHRNYPLREAKCLRRSPDLMLPLGPWYEAWGRLVATHPALTIEDRSLVLRQLLRGCDSQSRAWCVPNQVGYYRAIHGIASAVDLGTLLRELDEDSLVVLESEKVQMHIGLSEHKFAEELGHSARSKLRVLGSK